MTDKNIKLSWHNEKRKVNALVPYEHNPRIMTEAQVKTLKESIETFDLVEVPAIDTDDTLLAGHQRAKILQLLGRGEEEIDVRVPNRKLTEAEFKEYLIRSNQNRGSFDFDMLASIMGEEELMRIGFTPRELDMVDFSSLEGDSDMVEVDVQDEVKYELIFMSEANLKEFTTILKKIREIYPESSISDALVKFLKDNVK